MSYFKRFNTVFHKLYISYITITITITVLLGSTSYLYFSSNYKKELIKINSKMLEYEKNTLELSILKKVESLYASLSTRPSNPYFNDIMYLFDYPPEGNQTKIYNISEHLKNTFASNSGLIDAIHLYIPYSNILISSSWGVKYLNDNSESAINSIDWFKETSNPPMLGKWIDTRRITNEFATGYSVNGFTYLRTFPMFSNKIDFPGTIAIDINASSVANILKELHTSSRDNTFIINNNGKVIFHPDSSKLFTDLQSATYIKTALSTKSDSGNFISKVDGISSMVSYISIKNTDWKIISHTSVNEFYKQSSIIQQAILSLCALAIIIGFILTKIFSTKMYNPLKSLIHLTRNLLTTEQQEDKENEYTLINNAINKLSFKVIELEKNIIEYKPIVKHNLIMSLFNNSLLSRDELAERLNLAGICLNKPYYSCMLVELDKKLMRSIGIQNSHYARYNIIKIIESLSNDTISLLAIEISCTNIGVLINSNTYLNNQLIEIISCITDFGYTNFGIELKFSVSNWTSDSLNLSTCYEETITAIKYTFYLTDNKVIFYQDICKRETSSENIIYLSTEECMQAIKLRDINLVTSSLEKLLHTLITSDYSADYCRKKLLDIIDELCSCVNTLNFDYFFNTSNFYSYFETLKDVNEFKSWLIINVKKLYELQEQRSSLRNTDAIEKVKEYIANNLGNQLSLECAAHAVNLNPKYLSKLFKEVTGTNFLDYITELRLEKSKTLLLNTNLTVEQISYEIGYNTPAYFIKQFKKTYGDTPNSFKKSLYLKTSS